MTVGDAEAASAVERLLADAGRLLQGIGLLGSNWPRDEGRL
jgi:hypothetical protein